MNAISVMSVALCLGICTPLIAQSGSDTTISLKTVEIKSLRKNNEKTNYLQEVFTGNSLQSQFSDIYVKNYGVGQVSTISVRGMSAENTTVLWENIPINSAMTGLVDLNLIANAISQNLRFEVDQNRLTSAGSLSISQNRSKQNYLALSSTAFLSSLYSYKLEGGVHHKGTAVSWIQQYTHGINNFSYFDGSGTLKKMDKNNGEQINSQLFLNQRLSNQLELNAGFWFVHHDRAIPESEFYPNSVQQLLDKNYRAFLGVKSKELEVKLSYFNEKEHYADLTYPAFPYVSEHHIESWKGLVQYDKTISDKWKLNYILYPSIYHIETTNFTNHLTLYEAIQQVNLGLQINPKWYVQGGVKSQLHTNYTSYILPFVSATYHFQSRFSTSIVADINQRNPNANELYYNDPYAIGNLNLKPETNYQIRNSWKYAHTTNADHIQLHVEPYFMYSNDNIKWLPTTIGGFIYSPVNISSVYNYGINTHVEWVRKWTKNYSIRTIVSVNYIDSKNDEQKYIVYVPHIKSIFSLGLIHRDYEILFQNNYTGKRYTSADNSLELKPYFLSHIKGTYKLSCGKTHMQFSLGIDNLWNESYQENYGNFLPLRNYYASWTWLVPSL